MEYAYKINQLYIQNNFLKYTEDLIRYQYKINPSHKILCGIWIGKFFNCIYYLKMMYKDNFSYDFWAQKDDLEKALEKLQNYVSQQEIQFSNDINRLRNYHKFMVDSGIEDYIYGYEKLDLEYTKIC